MSIAHLSNDQGPNLLTHPFKKGLKSLSRFSPIVNAITQSEDFLGKDLPAPSIEEHTFLGPFFRISPLQGPVTNIYFSSPKTRDKGYIVNSQRALRMALGAHQKDLLDIVNLFVRAS